MYPKPIQDLIDSFKTLPGVGDKTAERYVLYLVNKGEQDILKFSSNLQAISNGINECKICHYITEHDTCSICNDERRENNVICVVESIRDVVVFEKLKMFKGRYHVLGGAISPMNGVGVDDLNIKTLVERVRDDKNINELIIATNPTFDGEATANYIAKVFENSGVEITRIAHGLPVGSDIEYADELTLFKAIEGRRKI